MPGHVVPFATPGNVLTVVHDLAFERFPDAYPPAQRSYLRLTTRWAERRSSLLLAVSESTRRDLIDMHGVDPGRVRVIHPGGGEEPLVPAGGNDGRLEAMGIEGPFVLTVGRIEPRKNQLAALAAVERLDGLRLVSAGAVRDRRMGDRLADSKRCRLLGPVSPADLEVLYSGATALVVPSLYEGFGLPLLEAFRRGLPVVCGRVSSLPEVAGDAAELVDDPSDPAELASAILRVSSDAARRAELLERGRRRAALYSWDHCATEVLSAIRSLL